MSATVSSSCQLQVSDSAPSEASSAANEEDCTFTSTIVPGVSSPLLLGPQGAEGWVVG